jgi:hypothetical protein
MIPRICGEFKAGLHGWKQYEQNLGKNLDLRRKFAQKGALTLLGTFGKVRFNVARSLWIDHVAIFNYFREV